MLMRLVGGTPTTSNSLNSAQNCYPGVMRSFLITSLMLNFLPWLVQAQSMSLPSNSGVQVDYSLHIANTAPNAVDHTSLMPVFRSPDGRLLALVALSTPSSGPLRPASPQIGAPSDWSLVDISNAISGNIGLRFGENYSYSLNVGLGERLLTTPMSAASVMVSCLPGANSTLGLPCWASRINANNSAPISSEYNAVLGASWSNNSNLGLDISYNMSWLNTAGNLLLRSAPTTTDLFALVTDDPIASALPNLVIPGAVAYTSGLGMTFGAHAHWWPSIDDTVDIGASMSRIQLNAQGGAALSFNQTALSLGLNHGALSGLIIGRVLTPAESINSTQRWSAIDLGVSWRTPWQGQLSIGTQNLWSSSPPPLSLAPAHDFDVGQARMPYVQYHQDL